MVVIIHVGDFYTTNDIYHTIHSHAVARRILGDGITQWVGWIGWCHRSKEVLLAIAVQVEREHVDRHIGIRSETTGCPEVQQSLIQHLYILHFQLDAEFVRDRTTSRKCSFIVYQFVAQFRVATLVDFLSILDYLIDLIIINRTTQKFHQVLTYLWFKLLGTENVEFLIHCSLWIAKQVVRVGITWIVLHKLNLAVDYLHFKWGIIVCYLLCQASTIGTFGKHAKGTYKEWVYMTLNHLRTLQIYRWHSYWSTDNLVYRITQSSETYNVWATKGYTGASNLIVTSASTSTLLIVGWQRRNTRQQYYLQITQVHTHLHSCRTGKNIDGMILELWLQSTSHTLIYLSSMLLLYKEIWEYMNILQTVWEYTICSPNVIVPK